MSYAQGLTDFGIPAISINRDQVVAEVGNIKITTEEYLYGYEYCPAFIKRNPESKKKYLNYLINEKLLTLKGFELELEKSELVREIYEAITDDIATEELYKEDILGKISVSREEVDNIITQKQLELEIKWLYTVDSMAIAGYIRDLQLGLNFDSLFYAQLSSKVFADERSMKTSRYQLGMKNTALAGIIDTLEAGSVSAPIHTEDGWYLVKLENIWRNIITNEAEHQKLAYEAEQAVTKIKMDNASEVYINNLMNLENPVIDKDAFAVLRSFLGQFVLTKDNYDEWNLSEELDKALKKYSGGEKLNYDELTLVNLSNGNISIEQCLIWYRNREQYIKFNKDNINTFSNSIMQMIWRMVRDELLIREAHERSTYERETVKKQSGWWKGKIVFSALLNRFGKQVNPVPEELMVKTDDKTESEIDERAFELSKKLFYEVQELKKKYPVSINENVLNSIKVSDENNPAAIELYAVKKGGLIPRTPYPTIDIIWELWE